MTVQQLREAMPFGQQPTYLFRDNDGIYGDEVSRFLVGTRIEEVKTAHRCPWQNPFVGRYGGTLRRELLDHVMVLNEGHLKTCSDYGWMTAMLKLTPSNRFDH